MKINWRKFEIGLVAALALMALLVHGYHLGSDDAEIYVPGIKQVADPALYPVNAVFFQQHAHLSLFSNLIGGSARVTYIPVDWAIFLWHAGSIFLLLLAARQLLRVCFTSRQAHWAGIALLAGVFSVPVAGTALVIMDPYLTARSLSTPATLFGIAAFAEGKWKQALGWLIFTLAIHPQMGVYGGIFLVCVAVGQHLPVLVKRLQWAPAALAILPFGMEFSSAHGVYRQVLDTRSYFFLSRWEWWEWLGVAAPLLLLYWLSRRESAGTLPPFQRLSAALVWFGLGATAGGILLSSSRTFDSLLRLQPMRSFHLLYVVFFVFLGGLAGESLLRKRTWRWCCLFVPLSAGMWTLQAQAYPASPHVEWPGAAYGSGWESAFLWIRGNTPKDAMFALDPDYMAIPADDQHGFRAIAERSALADNLKDSGAVSLFPELAGKWKTQVASQQNWRSFGIADYRRLAGQYGVNWVVLDHGQDEGGLPCPYRNAAVMVCRIP